MTQASYASLKETYLKAAKAAFCVFGDIDRVVINGTDFGPCGADSALVWVANNWMDVTAFVLTRIDGVCTLRVATRRSK